MPDEPRWPDTIQGADFYVLRREVVGAYCDKSVVVHHPAAEAHHGTVILLRDGRSISTTMPFDGVAAMLDRPVSS